MNKSSNEQNRFRMNIEKEEIDPLKVDVLGIDGIVVKIPLWRDIARQLFIGSVLSIILSLAYIFFFNTPKDMIPNIFSEMMFIIGGVGILFGGAIQWFTFSPVIRHFFGDRSMRVDKNTMRNGNAYLISSLFLIFFSFIIPGLFARL